jgi:hypothetical protein
MSEEDDSFASYKGVEEDDDGVCKTSICVKMWVKWARDYDGWVRKRLN